MEYVPGTSLRPLIAKRVLSIDDAVAVMKQVLAGVAYAHQQGMIHRDIKPENILVHESARRMGYGTAGLVKVTDFGLGKAAVKSVGDGSIAYSQSVGGDEARKIAGTLDYMAPEQRSGSSDTDHRADLYACGVVLFELLTGEKPAGTDLPSELNPKVPKHLDEVFRRAYARREKRFVSAEEFVKALAAPVAAPPPLPHVPPVPPPPRIHGALDVPPRIQSAGATGRQCPSCRRSVSATDQFCMHCGVQLVEWVLRCPQCGAYPDPSDRFCIFCGVAVSPQGAA
jgi:serine/threonine protein kinase